jgi:sugar diacid utilization regulator
MQTATRLAGIAVETALIADSQRRSANDLRVMSQTLERQNEDLIELSGVQTRLVEELSRIEGDPLEHVCQVLADYLKRSVMVWTIRGKIRSFAGSPQHRRLLERTARRHDLPRSLAQARASTFGSVSCHRIGYDDPSGTLLITPPLEAGPDHRNLVVGLATALIAVELEVERADRTRRLLTRPSMLLNLMLTPPSEVQAEAASAVFGLAADEGLRLAIANADTSEAADSYATRLNRLSPETRCLAACALNNQVLMVVPDGPISQVKSFVGQLITQVGMTEAGVGISAQFQGLMHVFGAGEQAKAALAMASATGIAAFEEVGPIGELLKHIPRDGAAAFVAAVLGGAEQYDCKRAGHLVESLSAYVRHNGSLSTAAKELGIHPNTLLLRLDRVREVTGLNVHSQRDLGLICVALGFRQLVFGNARPLGA